LLKKANTLRTENFFRGVLFFAEKTGSKKTTLPHRTDFRVVLSVAPRPVLSRRKPDKRNGWRFYDLWRDESGGFAAFMMWCARNAERSALSGSVSL
jgi:hypothetical protein